jgi:hypothetical protein
VQALRLVQEVSEDGCLHVRVPEGFGKRFELIILPLDREGDSSWDFMKMQEESGFSKSVLGSSEEDVWNDL